jgi:ribosomal protein S18 acetylase RimI-like enzyme
MSKRDFSFAVEETDKMGWGLSERDFEFSLELEPEGCFVLLDDSERIGIATTVSFGTVAWFGNLVVNEDRRNKGAGSTLVNHALEYLRSRGVKTVGLYAYKERIHFYERLGFRSDSELSVLRGTGFASKPKTIARRVSEENVDEIMDFDHSCFVASRRKMLVPIILDSDNLCYATYKDGRIAAYAVAKVFDGMVELGPLLCVKGEETLAVELLKTMMNRLCGSEISLFVPVEETSMTSMLEKGGFRESFRVRRMFFGPPVESYCVYLAESLERG